MKENSHKTKPRGAPICPCVDHMMVFTRLGVRLGPDNSSRLSNLREDPTRSVNLRPTTHHAAVSNCAHLVPWWSKQNGRTSITTEATVAAVTSKLKFFLFYPFYYTFSLSFLLIYNLPLRYKREGFTSLSRSTLPQPFFFLRPDLAHTHAHQRLGSSSLSRLFVTPYYKSVQITQATRTEHRVLLLSRGSNQYNPCVPFCATIRELTCHPRCY
jgi:hypothetical protein